MNINNKKLIRFERERQKIQRELDQLEYKQKLAILQTQKNKEQIIILSKEIDSIWRKEEAYVITTLDKEESKRGKKTN